MSPKPERIHALAGCFFAGVILCGFALDVASERPPFPHAKLTRRGYREGGNARALSLYLEETSRLREEVRPLYNELLFSIAGTSSQVVVAGRDMLFLRESVLGQTPEIWQEHRAEVLETVLDVQRTIQRFGGSLFVMVVPDRIRVYPDQLPQFDPRLTPKADYLSSLQNEFRTAGLGVIDYLEAVERRPASGVGARYFWRGDHHWNPHGAQLAAAEITAVLSGFELRARDGLALSSHEAPIAGPGSLLGKMGWRPGSALFRQFYEPLHRQEVIDAEGRVHDPSWFQEVVLVADSFGWYQIAGHVTREAGREVADMSTGGKGAVFPISHLIESLARGARPKVVVWIFSEQGTYGPSHPMRGWDLDSLPMPRDARPWRKVDLQDLQVRDGALLESRETPSGARVLALSQCEQQFSLRLPRSSVPGPFLMVALRSTAPVRVGYTVASLALLDERAAASPRAERRGQPLTTRESSPERLLCFPVPSGDSDLVLLANVGVLGTEFEILDLATPVEASISEDRASTTAAPETATRLRPGSGLRFLPSDELPWLEHAHEGRPFRVVQLAETGAVLFGPTLPSGGRIEMLVSLRSEGGETPAVLSVYYGGSETARGCPVLQVEVDPREGPFERVYPVPLDPEAGSAGPLHVEWSLPADMDATRALVGFPRAR